ncbi:MAG: DUF3795 domain-containing protein [Candidatus Bathyarchaeota archaeon]|nr:MAG: DUF3795 domain-containing protein [Candidatus Bathyarchaeota archaeon]
MDVEIGYCGVSCDHCGMRTRIPEIAGNLKRFIDAYGYAEWVSNITQDFSFDELMRGLNWFITSGCPGCLKGGGMPRCEVRACCQRKRLENCYFCEDFSSCDKLSYQKETYNIEENYDNIKRTSYASWLKKEEKKTDENFDNIEYLERRNGK